jgi:cytochrome c oxidase assembly protein subunit 11
VTLKKSPKSKKNTLVFLASLGVTMFAFAFASVPLYRMFCQRTGYGGTPKIALEESKKFTSRRLKVRFNADIHRDLPWRFQPLQMEMDIYIGQNNLAFYRFENVSDQPITGMATYNVTPDKAAQYFNKIDCFCFEEQHLEAHQAVEMPVQFFIDPAMIDDPNLEDVKTVTLSYTFFHAKDPVFAKLLGGPGASIK